MAKVKGVCINKYAMRAALVGASALPTSDDAACCTELLVKVAAAQRQTPS